MEPKKFILEITNNLAEKKLCYGIACSECPLKSKCKFEKLTNPELNIWIVKQLSKL